MIENDIVEFWKTNDKYFDSPNISEELRVWTYQHKEDMQFLSSHSGWVNLTSEDVFYSTTVYRLHPNFIENDVKFKKLTDGVFKVYVCGKYQYTIEYNSVINGWELSPRTNMCYLNVSQIEKIYKFILKQNELLKNSCVE